jgi:hypothetical protein
MRIRMSSPVRVAVALFVVATSLSAQQSVAPTISGPTADATAQTQTPPAGSSTGPFSADTTKKTQKAPQPTHRFWDRENDLLFAGVAAGRALDYSSTLNLRRRGLDEIFLTNSVVDNHPLFAGIEAAATATSIGVSYLFHATGHHRLERWTSAVHLGVAFGGAARNYALKKPHPN